VIDVPIAGNVALLSTVATESNDRPAVVVAAAAVVVAPMTTRSWAATEQGPGLAVAARYPGCLRRALCRPARE